MGFIAMFFKGSNTKIIEWIKSKEEATKDAKDIALEIGWYVIKIEWENSKQFRIISTKVKEWC